MMFEHTQWVEKYRPHRVQDCILPEQLKATFQAYVDKKEVPSLVLTGTAGIGKTSVAKALCDEVGCDYIVINGSLENGIDVLRNKITNFASSMSMNGGRKVVIIDEADWMNKESLQPALRGAIEQFSLNCSFIFTCNHLDRIMEELHSRFAVIDFNITGSKAKLASMFLKRVEYILDTENITYDREVVIALITKFFPDNRRVINELQMYAVTGSIDKGLLAKIAGAQIDGLMTALKAKNFNDARKWIVNNLDADPKTFYRKLYDAMFVKVKPDSIPQMILTLAKYMEQSKDSRDFEINAAACIVEVICDIEFI